MLMLFRAAFVLSLFTDHCSKQIQHKKKCCCKHGKVFYKSCVTYCNLSNEKD